MNIKHKPFLVFAVLILLSLLIAGCQADMPIEINTDDGLVDEQWSADAMVLDEQGDADDPADIVKAWVVVDPAFPNKIFFRADTNAPGDVHVLAEMDCNHNGKFNDAEDFYMQVDTYWEKYSLGPGSRSPWGTGGWVSANPNPARREESIIERIGATTEWQFEISEITKRALEHPESPFNIEACLWSADIRFSTFASTTVGVSDVTEPVGILLRCGQSLAKPSFTIRH